MTTFKHLLDLFLKACGIVPEGLTHYNRSKHILEDLVVMPQKEYQDLIKATQSKKDQVVGGID